MVVTRQLASQLSSLNKKDSSLNPNLNLNFLSQFVEENRIKMALFSSS